MSLFGISIDGDFNLLSAMAASLADLVPTGETTLNNLNVTALNTTDVNILDHHIFLSNSYTTSLSRSTGFVAYMGL